MNGQLVELLKQKKEQKLAEELAEKANRFLSLKVAQSTTASKTKFQEVMATSTRTKTKHIDLQGSSLCLFSKENKLRIFLAKVVGH